MYLDAKSLLKVSETCHYFKNIVSSSTKLLKKIKVTVELPENGDDSQLAKIENHISKYSQLTRPYQNLETIRLNDYFLYKKARNKTNFLAMVKQLGGSVKSLSINHCHILQNDLVSLLLPFIHLQECSFKNLMLFDHIANETVENLCCPGIKKLVLSECDFFCLVMFQSFNQVQYLEITNPAYNRTDIELFENFLIQQENLKTLILKNFRFNSTYSTARLAEVPFQLDTLSLDNVNWDIISHCEAFLKSQKNLKKLEFVGFNRWVTPWVSNRVWFKDLLNHIFAMNAKLKSITFDTSSSSFLDFKDEEFIPGIVTKSVEELVYIRAMDEKSQLLQIFTRIFPSLRKLSLILSGNCHQLLEHLSLFKHLELLNLQMPPKSFSSFQLGTTSLDAFQYCATNEEKSGEKLTEFFKQNPSIKHLSLNIEPLTVEEITEMIICLAPNLETFSISDLHLNEAEAELFATNFPRLRQIRSDLPLPPQIVSVLEKSKISFEVVKTQVLFKED